MAIKANNGIELKLIFEFNQITLDTAQYRLCMAGSPIAVEPQVFDLLAYLLNNRNRVVTRDELLGNIWKDKVVTDSALGARIKDARKAVGDSGDRQEVIKTIHGRGYQFIAPTTELKSNDSFTKPQTHYAQNGDVSIAYQVFGDGPDDLIVIPGWLSNLDLFWDLPLAASFFLKLANFCRVILIDRRGTGLSDRVAPPSLEIQMRDVIGVMEAVGSRHTALLGYSEGGSISAQFAATYPKRTSALILSGTAARWSGRTQDYPYGPSIDDSESWMTEVENNWGGPIAIDLIAPSLADNEEFREWLSKNYRSSASRAVALELLRMADDMDLYPILPSIQAPTLVLQATGDLVCPFEAGRDLALRIPNVKFVPLDTNDHLPYVGCPDEVISNIQSFLGGLQNKA